MIDPDSLLIVGCGYLGRELIGAWSGPVWGTTRDETRFEVLRQSGVNPVHWDVLAGGAPLPACAFVVHAVGFDRRQSATMRQVYVDGLLRTLEQLRTPTRIVYVSSTGVYGDADGEWVDEATPAAPLDESGIVCLEAERALADVAGQRGWDYVIVRLAGLYGPGRWLGVRGLLAGEPVAGDPEQYVNLIHVADAAQVVAAAARRGRSGEIYLAADGHPPTRRELYGYTASLLGVDLPEFAAKAPTRRRGNRRIANRKVIEQLQVTLQYADFRAGLNAGIATGSFP